jgi:molybdopterin/thiamine biosynthesis adenylyltransferase
MAIIASPASIWENARGHLFGGVGERFGFFLAGIAPSDSGPRFCIREYIPIQDDDLETSWESPRDIKLDALLAVVNRAKKTGLAVIENHNHFGSNGSPRFSTIDRTGLKEFASYMMTALDGRPYAALVWDQKSVDAVYWEKPDAPKPVSHVVVSGNAQSVAVPTSARKSQLRSQRHDERMDRQILLLGEDGQTRIGLSRVAVVGLGGLGSHVVQQLGYLGVRDFILVDPDVVDRSNLNRLVGASLKDIGKPKAYVAERMLRQVAGAGDLRVTSLERSAMDPRSFEPLSSSDLIFGCVDNDGARLVLNEISRALVLPYIDISCGVEAKDGVFEEAGGRIAVAIPDGPCLDCMTEIDRAEANYFLASPEKRQQDQELGYVGGWDLKAPSVISFNGVLASAAVSEFLLFTTGLRATAPLTYYYVRTREADSQRMVPRIVKKNPECYSCSLAGLGRTAGFERYEVVD